MRVSPCPWADSDNNLFLLIQKNSIPDVNVKPHEKGWDSSGYIGRLVHYFTGQTLYMKLKAWPSLSDFHYSLVGSAESFCFFFSSSILIRQNLILF